MTNFERIKAMTQEELATQISRWSYAADYEDDDFDPDILRWLNAEKVEE